MLQLVPKKQSEWIGGRIPGELAEQVRALALATETPLRSVLALALADWMARQGVVIHVQAPPSRQPARADQVPDEAAQRALRALAEIDLLHKTPTS